MQKARDFRNAVASLFSLRCFNILLEVLVIVQEYYTQKQNRKRREMGFSEK